VQPKAPPSESTARLMRRKIVPTGAPPRASSQTYPPRAPRKVVPVDVVVELPSGSFFSTVVRDLSTSGAFVVTKRDLEIGTIVSLELRVPAPGVVAPSSHRVNAKIVRRTELGYGLAFVGPSRELVTAIGKIAD
jgi:hypothetical protein